MVLLPRLAGCTSAPVSVTDTPTSRGSDAEISPVDDEVNDVTLVNFSRNCVEADSGSGP